LWKISIPYLLNVQKLTDKESILIWIKWLDACNNIRELDFEPLQRIKENIKNVKSYLPISKAKLKEENIGVYILLITS
jgi:hypothetical protein